MARDWRKVALAVLAASALASVCPQSWRLEAQDIAQVSKKAPAKSRPAAKARSEDGEKAAPKRQDPAEAQRAVEHAAKLLQSGKAEQAEQALSAILSGGSLPPAIMARALYLRGMAYRQHNKPAQAISDLTSALWLKGGLAAEDRADALKQRSAAYADAGLTESGAVASASTPAPKEPAATERPAPKSWGTTTTPAGGAGPSNAGQTSQASGNWFKNWFNTWSTPGAQASGTSTASIDKTQPQPPAHAPQVAPTARVATAWSSKTEVSPAAAQTAPAQTAPARAAPAPPSGGKYRVQLAAVRTQREAEALAAKAKRALGSLSRDPEVDQTVLGNMGSFYRVRVGPFTTAQEAQAVCAQVKGSGFDCLTVTQ